MLMLILGLALVGLVLYLVETYIPMDPVIKTVLRVVVVIFVIVYLAEAFGVANLPILRVR